jgi:hypothetical protein
MASIEVDKTQMEDGELCDGCGGEDDNQELEIKLPHRATFLRTILCVECRQGLVDGIEDD